MRGEAAIGDDMKMIAVDGIVHIVPLPNHHRRLAACGLVEPTWEAWKEAFTDATVLTCLPCSVEARFYYAPQ